MGIKLDLGCGAKRKRGYIGVDINDDVGAEVVHDLNTIPWPWPDNHFDQIMALDVLEYLDDLSAVLDEAHRVIQPGCEMYLRGNIANELPYSISSFDDLELWRVASKSQNASSVLSHLLISQPEDYSAFDPSSAYNGDDSVESD